MVSSLQSSVHYFLTQGGSAGRAGWGPNSLAGKVTVIILSCYEALSC